MLLSVRDLDVHYGPVHALRAVSLDVKPAEIVAVLGANGAGKSSLLRALLGVEQPTGGRIDFEGRDIRGWPTSRRVAAGMVLVPEGRRIVTTLTVHENLLLGAFHRRLTRSLAREIDRIYERFPNLAARRNSSAAVLSGGEQQMLAIGRALVAAPKLMMLDEPSLGLSPRLAEEAFSCIQSLSRHGGISILLVEQNTQRALELAHRAYVIELGSIVSEGTPEKVLADSTLLEAYLGRMQARAAGDDRASGGELT